MFNPRKSRPGVALAITERSDTKNNLGGSPPRVLLFHCAGCRPAGAVFPSQRQKPGAQVTLRQDGIWPDISYQQPAAVGGGAEIINLGFSVKPWFLARPRGSTGSSFLFPHRSKHPLWERGPSPCPLILAGSRGGNKFCLHTHSDKCAFTSEGWKINPGNGSILARRGERERGGGAGHLHKSKPRMKEGVGIPIKWKTEPERCWN